jgi:hypothetical protein
MLSVRSTCSEGRRVSIVAAIFVLAPLAAAGLGCSSSPSAESSKGSGADSGSDQDAAPPAILDGGSGWDGGVITETGILIDYETLAPVIGLTVTDNGVSATTDDQGAYTFTVPSNVATIQPVVTGTNYSKLYFPVLSAIGTSVNTGTNVIPDSPTLALEQQILANDTTKALVQIVAQVAPSCASAVGGTLQVVSPAGASFRYFSTANVPATTVTSFQAVKSPRPVAVVYDIPVGSPLTVAVTHPTCTLAPYPITAGGEEVTGQVTTMATEPGDVNAALVILLQ